MTSSELICKKNHAVALSTNIENATLSVTLNDVPNTKPSAMTGPNFEATSTAPAIVPKNVPAIQANNTDRNSPTVAMALRIGFFANRATRNARNGATTNAATTFTG